MMSSEIIKDSQSNELEFDSSTAAAILYGIAISEVPSALTEDECTYIARQVVDLVQSIDQTAKMKSHSRKRALSVISSSYDNFTQKYARMSTIQSIGSKRCTFQIGCSVISRRSSRKGKIVGEKAGGWRVVHFEDDSMARYRPSDLWSACTCCPSMISNQSGSSVLYSENFNTSNTLDPASGLAVIQMGDQVMIRKIHKSGVIVGEKAGGWRIVEFSDGSTGTYRPSDFYALPGESVASNSSSSTRSISNELVNKDRAVELSTNIVNSKVNVNDNAQSNRNINRNINTNINVVATGTESGGCRSRDDSVDTSVAQSCAEFQPTSALQPLMRERDGTSSGNVTTLSPLSADTEKECNMDTAGVSTSAAMAMSMNANMGGKHLAAFERQRRDSDISVITHDSTA